MGVIWGGYLILKSVIVVLMVILSYYICMVVLTEDRHIEGRVEYKFESYNDTEYVAGLEFNEPIEDSYVLIIYNELTKEDDIINVRFEDYFKVNIGDRIRLLNGKLEVVNK